MYCARSFVLVEIGELLLEHVEEVLPVGHFVRSAGACRMSDLVQKPGVDMYTSGTPYAAASLGDRVALDFVIYRWVVLSAMLAAVQIA